MNDDVRAELGLIRREAQKIIAACDDQRLLGIKQSSKIISSATNTAIYCSGDGSSSEMDMDEYMKAAGVGV